MAPFDLNMFILGCLGGLLPDILRMIKSRHEMGMPAYLRMPLFWVGVLFSVALGGLAAWVFGAALPNEAVAYGFAAPGLIEGLAGGLQARQMPAAPRTAAPEAVPARYTLMDWWAR